MNNEYKQEYDYLLLLQKHSEDVLRNAFKTKCFGEVKIMYKSIKALKEKIRRIEEKLSLEIDQ